MLHPPTSSSAFVVSYYSSAILPSILRHLMVATVATVIVIVITAGMIAIEDFAAATVQPSQHSHPPRPMLSMVLAVP